MKKILTIAVLFAALMTAVPAKAEVKFGLKGGLNLTSMSLDANAISKSNQAGFFIGPTFKFTIPIVGLGFDASALYDQRKGTISGVNGNETSIKEQSIQIPINIRYGIGLGSTASIYFFAGPQFGFNVGGKTVSETINNISEERTDQHSGIVHFKAQSFSNKSIFQSHEGYHISCDCLLKTYVASTVILSYLRNLFFPYYISYMNASPCDFCKGKLTTVFICKLIYSGAEILRILFIRQILCNK